MEKTEKNHVLENVIVVLLPLAVFAIWVLTCWDLNYQVHDDRYMMEFVSGKFLGHSDAHLVYIKYLFGLFLKFMYTTWTGIDWYGTFLFVIQFATIGIINWYLVCRQKKLRWKVVTVAVFYSFFCLCWLNEVTCFTYTTVAALVGAAILVVFALAKDRLQDFVIVILLCLCCFNLRADVFFMVLPFAGVLWLYKCIKTKDIRYVKFLIGLGVALAVCFGLDQYAYKDKEWKAYQEYNQARTLFYDYYYDDMVVYENYKETYEKLGITKNACEILKSYDLSLYDEKLYEKIKELPQYHMDKGSIFHKMWNGLKTVVTDGLLESKVMTIVSILFWGIAILLALLGGDKNSILIEAVYIVCHVILWEYLGCRGRILPRVAHSMLLIQIITPCICGLFAWEHRKERSFKWKRKLVAQMGLVGFGVILIGVCSYDILHARKLINKNHKEAGWRDHYIMEEYCKENPDNFYFFDVFSVVECKYTYTFHNPNTYENFLSLGDWFGNSPIYKEKLKLEQINSVRDAVLHNKNVYIIGIKGRDLSYITGITNERLELKAVDDLTGGNDEYVVYKIKYLTDKQF
ncbi:uncharacterized protein BN648_01975 [Clostridium sp. CAG:411]|jgi:hypothetical protein|nr:uncharacterized protein BN648_01975 [Clostridium sp. CAG:411]